MNASKNINRSEVFAFVPSYNHAPFVEKCLKSIFKQTLPPKKLLVIDDGSKDDSPRIIEQVLKDCPFEAEFIRRENRGLSATLNEGFARSTGAYFAYLGSDDVWLPDFCRRRAELLDSRPDAVLAFGHAYLIDEQDQIFDCTRNWVEYSEQDILANLLRGVVPITASVAFRRSALEKMPWNESAVLEDYELYLKLSAKGKFAVDDNVSAAWRQHGYNTSRDFPKMMNEWLEAQNRVAPAIGISPPELTKIQSELKFTFVADFIRHGEKSAAARMLWENRGSARSASEIGKMLIRLLIPQSYHDWHRRGKRRQKIRQYGKIEI
jgi:alpha-1,3-rhamnosyltransferase